MHKLFTCIPLNRTIDYIIHQIYTAKKIAPLVPDPKIFKKLLYRLTNGSTFIANGRYVRQIDGCAIGGTLSVTLSAICMTQCLDEKIAPKNPKFFCLYVDDSYNRGSKEGNKETLESLRSFDPKLKFTVEVNPDRFLDTRVDSHHPVVVTGVYRKKGKLPNHWSSMEPNRYKRNAILCDLHRAHKIASNFDEEVTAIKKKFQSAGYPSRFVNSVIDQFVTDNIERIIPTNLFEKEDERPVYRVTIPYCPKNENLSKGFLSKLEQLCPKVKFFIIWKTSKLRSCFPLKDKPPHKCSVIYKGVCSCGAEYIGETARCEHVRFAEHDNIKGISEPAKHLAANVNKRGRAQERDIEHRFTWTTICRAPLQSLKRRILEGLYVAKWKPNLNEQAKCHKLLLFTNGIT